MTQTAQETSRHPCRPTPKQNESQAFLAWQKGYKPTNSFATEQFHSINAFYLVDPQGKRHAVRWAAVPLADAAPALDAGNANALQDELRDRLKQGPVQYALTFTFANPDDIIENGAIPWDGWAMQGAAGNPVVLPGGVVLPALVSENLALYGFLRETHGIVAWLFIGLVVLHIGAALHHGLVRKDNVLGSMTGCNRHR